jgi:hypothetical protein
MECNKDEAFRAKGVAESLMVKKDFQQPVEFCSKPNNFIRIWKTFLRC